MMAAAQSVAKTLIGLEEGAAVAEPRSLVSITPELLRGKVATAGQAKPVRSREPSSGSRAVAVVAVMPPAKGLLHPAAAASVGTVADLQTKYRFLQLQGPQGQVRAEEAATTGLVVLLEDPVSSSSATRSRQSLYRQRSRRLAKRDLRCSC